MATLKSIRNKIVDNRPAQAALRKASRARVIPPRVYEKIPPLGSHPVITPEGNTIAYVADLSDMMARQVVWGNLQVWEATSLQIFSKLARSSVRFLDVGAYTGIYSLIACADGPGEAIAFEPNPAVRPLLARNIRANNFDHRVTVIPKAASDTPGTATMTIPFDTTAARLDASGTGPCVEVTTVDDVLAGRRVDIMKIDVERLEPQVLKGAANSLSQYHPALIIECLDQESFVAVDELVRGFGYDNCQHLGQRGVASTTSFVEEPAFANFLWQTTHR
ncbi:MAG: FkbM family methyltransferase [Candidatus Nanopelagicales bacterium]|nr:FkbM family methyltransferase [Candidatus Nanopelagicales bacterium]MDZ4248943.1 FkbM family methyltransferase [Candidatus Nanopelagicales bacterium]